MRAISKMLDGEIRAAAEAFFGAELSNVELHYRPLPALLNANALTYGNRIYMDADERAGFSQRSLELLGHELTHVVQQWQGRVQSNLLLHGLPANQDAALEREAKEMGKRFACGGPSELPRLPLSRCHSSVVQRDLRVGGRDHWGLQDLHPQAATILKLINGGDEWLDWIRADRNAVYEFTDEQQLLAGIQMGLHGTPEILLAKLGVMVHPFKLVELSEAELKVILAVENGSEDNSVAETNAGKVLHAHQIWSQSDLMIGQDFLSQVGIETAQVPLFQATTLASSIALFNLVDGASSKAELNSMLQKEAAAFAVRYAQDQLEFVDYYQFYMSTVKDPDPKPRFAERRARLAESILEEISPLLYSLLWCPSLPEFPALSDVPSIVQSSVAGGHPLGFSRLSSALWQINEKAGLDGATGQPAQGIIKGMMDQIHEVLLLKHPVTIGLSQDGIERYYEYAPGKLVPQLCYSAYGNLTLRNFELSGQAELPTKNSEKAANDNGRS